jgi:CRP/FNR family transcriptional regulator, cyclic AMP receptor protein
MAEPSADLIRGVPMFADLDDKSVAQLRTDFVARRFAAGTEITEEGSDRGLNFFVVESGEADVTVGGNKVGTLGPGTSFGEVALVDKSVRTATVTARTDMVTFSLPSWSFRSFVASRPEVSWKLLELLAERLRAAQRG